MDPTHLVFAADSTSIHPVAMAAITIGLALLTGIAVPLIFKLWDRSASKQQKISDNLEAATKVILDQKLKELDAKYAQLKTDYTEQMKGLLETIAKTTDTLTTLNNEFLSRLSGCQTRFVSVETYKQDLQTQKHYYKLLYAMIQRSFQLLDDDGE